MPAWGMFMQKVYSDPKLALDKNAKFFRPSDSTLVKNVCTEAGDVLISGGATGNWGEVSEDAPESEYGK